MYTAKQLLAEAIGTFFLCFAGIAAIVSTAEPINSGAGLLGIALAHGLALSVAVSIFAGVSGAHFNPAVTIGFLSTGRIAPPLALLYIVAQLVGATLAAAACKAIFPADAVDAAQLGIPLPNVWVTVPILLLTEFILTFLLMTAIFGTAVDNRAVSMKLGGFGIGLTVAFDILAGGAVTGASMNPARSFGPALVHGNFDYHGYYWLAPIAGAVAAALLYHFVLLEKESTT
ncbi:MAG: aquaporin [Planctomycetes bacterium]|nr:aquaporin [Planctomycetota bacterium]